MAARCLRPSTPPTTPTGRERCSCSTRRATPPPWPARSRVASTSTTSHRPSASRPRPTQPRPRAPRTSRRRPPAGRAASPRSTARWTEGRHRRTASPPPRSRSPASGATRCSATRETTRRTRAARRRSRRPRRSTSPIRQPTASAITFARIADALQCRTATHAVKVAGRIRTVRRHGKRVTVRGPARTVRKRVRKCHARTVVRTVRVVLKRHGKPVLRHGKPVFVKRRVRRVVLPHAVNEPPRRIGHGKATTVNGFIGLADGTAIAGQAVDVYSSPNDNAPRFRLMRTVTTDASGEWTAKVPAGPSRLIEAVYPGNGTTEPATSSTVKLMVPARIAVSISPRVLPWSGKIAISGRLVGGWVPRDGVALRLRVPYPGGQSVQEPFRTNSRGAFKFDWSYGSGRGVVSLPVRRGDHGDGIRLSLGRGRQPGRQGHVRAAHAAASTAPSPPARLTLGRPRAGRLLCDECVTPCKKSVSIRGSAPTGPRRRAVLEPCTAKPGARRVFTGNSSSRRAGAGTLDDQWSETSSSPPTWCSCSWSRCSCSGPSGFPRSAASSATGCGTSGQRSTGSTTSPRRGPGAVRGAGIRHRR